MFGVGLYYVRRRVYVEAVCLAITCFRAYESLDFAGVGEPVSTLCGVNISDYSQT